jgi:hypothetical protein
MTEFHLPGGMAYRIVQVSGDLGYVVEIVKPGDREPVQMAAFRSHAEATAWVVRALKEFRAP